MPDTPPNLSDLARLARQLASMPTRPRHVFERHRFNEVPLRVIAVELGIDEPTVTALLADAMVHLDRGER